MADDFKIEGLDEILSALERLPAKVTRKVLFDANKDILNKVVKNPLKNAIPYGAATKRGIKVVAARGTKTGVYVGVTTDAFWLRFLEFGTGERFTRGSLTRKRTSRYHDKGRLGSSPNVTRGAIAPRNAGIVSTIESKINDVLLEVQKDYGNYLMIAIGKQLKKYEIKKR